MGRDGSAVGSGCGQEVDVILCPGVPLAFRGIQLFEGIKFFKCKDRKTRITLCASVSILSKVNHDACSTIWTNNDAECDSARN